MDILLAEAMGKPLWAWLLFLSIVVTLLVLDLGVFHRKAHEIGVGESLKLSAFYVAVGVAFSGWIWYRSGDHAAFEYLTGFFVEWSLAVDNIFVIATIFTYFAIPRAYQHRVLIYGILGVVVLRAVMIGAGAAIIHEFEWVLHIFAAFLLLTGIKMLFTADKGYDVGANPVLTFMRRRFRITRELHGERFLVRQEDPKTGRRVLCMTPLLLALVLVEIADIIFAVDSIPAVFMITTDPYIVYTSNIFAVLGLRALFFTLSAMIHRFIYLKYALAVVLIFIGGKIFVTDMLDLGKMPPSLSLAITLAILGSGVLVSMWRTRQLVAKEARRRARDEAAAGERRGTA